MPPRLPAEAQPAVVRFDVAGQPEPGTRRGSGRGTAWIIVDSASWPTTLAVRVDVRRALGVGLHAIRSRRRAVAFVRRPGSARRARWGLLMGSFLFAVSAVRPLRDLSQSWPGGRGRSITWQVMGAPRPAVARRGMTMVTPARRPIGHMRREWRQRRRKSQLALACEADISTAPPVVVHRDRPRAARPRRWCCTWRSGSTCRCADRNVLLTAAGWSRRASARARSTTRSSAAAPQRRSTWILAAHEAYPALALDAHWNLLASNKAVPPLLAGVDPSPL